MGLFDYNKIEAKYQAKEGVLAFGDKTVEEKLNSGLFALAAYFIIQMILGTIALFVIGYYLSIKYNVNFQELIDAISYGSEDAHMINVVAIANAYVNFVVFLGMIIPVVYLLRYYVIHDILHFKINYKKLIPYILVSIVVFYVVVGYANVFVDKYASNSTSENQETVVAMLKASPLLGFFTVVIIAPILEELVFRKAIFQMLKKYKDVIPFVVSTLVFALIHLLGDNGDLVNTLLISISYLVPSILFGLIYIKSNKNIYSTIIIHMINNILSFIAVFVI